MPKSVHVMIVEDERVIALHLRKQLEKLGYERTSAHSAGADALKAISLDPPDIILMDIRIDGDIDGIETAAGIPQDLMIPVIYLSAYSEDSTLARAKQTRPYGFLLKPFSERELHATIQMALERRKAEVALRETQQRLSLAMTAAQMSCWEIDVHTQEMQSAGIGHFGVRTDAETVTESLKTFLDRVVPEDRSTVEKAFNHAIEHGDFYDVVFKGINDHDEIRWIRARGKLFINEHLGTRRLIGMMQDITEQRAANEKLRDATTVYETTQDGILILDTDLNVTSANKAYYRITGKDAEKTLNKPPYFIDENPDIPDFYHQLSETLRRTRHWQHDVEITDATGNELSLSIRIIAVENDAHELTHFVAVVTDRTAIRKAEQELRYLAQYDGLTGMPNRVLATDRLNRAVERCDLNNSMLACLFLDIDDFKNINDTLGHTAGDQVLLVAANRINAATNRFDTTARLGGDEFLIIRENIMDEADAAHLAQAILTELQRPFYIVGHEMTMSASIGISLYPADTSARQDLIRLADTAMYAAKKRGRRTYAFYQSEMTETATKYMTRSLELRRGLENNELVLHYQPKVDAMTGDLLGVEALLRWNHPQSGLVGPNEIIPVAEQSGLIIEVGDWVLREACAQAKRWQVELGKNIKIAVNVSVRQLKMPSFADAVRYALTAADLPAEYLELEITESMLQDEASMISMLHELRDVGVSLAIDDFGTGYSCLRSIKSLPIERIKIDRAFVKGLPDNNNDAALIEAMLAMAHALDLRVTAEGIETPEQCDFLRKMGCPEFQGFLFSKPVPAHEVFGMSLKEDQIS